MNEQRDLKASFERIENLLTRSPQRGRATATAKVRLRDGLTCEVEEGSWRLVADMGQSVGGAEKGPPPGVYGRAALGSCMAITYALWAAKRGIPLDELEIEVEADFDTGAMFGTADVPAGYGEVRCVVRVASPAPRADVERMLDEADAHSPYVDVFTRAHKLTRTVRYG